MKITIAEKKRIKWNENVGVFCLLESGTIDLIFELTINQPNIKNRTGPWEIELWDLGVSEEMFQLSWQRKKRLKSKLNKKQTYFPADENKNNITILRSHISKRTHN